MNRPLHHQPVCVPDYSFAKPSTTGFAWILFTCTSVSFLVKAVHNTQVRTQLAASKSDVSSLKAEVSRAEELTKEMSSLRQALEQAEEGRRTLAQQSKREQAALERQLQTAGKNRDQLAEQAIFSFPTDCNGSCLLL